MNRFFRNSTVAKKKEAHQTALGWFLGWMILAGCPARAEIIQTNWVREFGLGTLVGAAYSPKGDSILTYGDFGAYLWSVKEGTLQRQFHGHNRGVTGAAFSPDGTQVLTGSYDQTAKLWSAGNGAWLRTLTGHSRPVTSVAFSPDGTRALTGSYDQTAKLWSTRDGSLLRTFAGHANTVQDVAFSPDGTRVLTGSYDQTTKLWSAGEGTLLRTFTGHSGPVTSVAFSPDGTQVLTSAGDYWTTGSDYTAKLWSVADGKLLRTFVGHSVYVTSVAFAPDGTRVLTGSADQTAKLWSLGEGRLLRTFAGHSAWVESVAFSPDGTQVLTGSDDQTAKLWSAKDGTLLRTFSTPSGGIFSVAFSPDGTQVLTGSLDGASLLWDTGEPGPQAPRILVNPVSQTNVVDGTVIFSVSASGTPPLVYQWQKNGVYLRGENAASLTLTHLQMAHAGSYRVRITNTFGLAISQPAILTVITNPTTAVLFITNAVIVSRLAGSGVPGAADGRGTNAQFNFPSGGYADRQGNVYVADFGNHRIRKVAPDGTVSTVAGTGVPGYADGPADQAMFNQPLGVCADGAGNMYVADTGNNRIRKISLTGLVSTVAGSGLSGYIDGSGAWARFDFPNDLVVDGSGGLYVSEFNNHTVRKVTAEGNVSTWVGNGTPGEVDGARMAARLNQPGGLAMDTQGNLYVSEFGGQRIRKISAAGEVSTAAGSGVAGYMDGPGSQAQFRNPDGVVVDPAGYLYVADNGNDVIRRVSPSGWVETVAGTGVAGFADGEGAKSQFVNPSGLGMDGSGTLYVADGGNHRVRQIVVAGILRTDTTMTISAFKWLPNGKLSITAKGNPGTTCHWEGSSDLRNWTPLVETTLQTSIWEWTDPESANFPRRFYRIAIP